VRRDGCGACDEDLEAEEGEMVKWSYKRVTYDVLEVLDEGFEAKLNAIGSDGWELVSTFDRERGGNSKECFFIFRRQVA
jgi:hypothetical protein